MGEAEPAANGCKNDQHEEDRDAENDVVDHRLTPAFFATAVSAMITPAMITRLMTMSFTVSLLQPERRLMQQ